LDHEISPVEALQFCSDLDARARRRGVAFAESLTFHESAETVADLRTTALHGLGAEVDAHNVIARLCADLADPRTHRPEPDDTDRGDRHEARNARRVRISHPA